MIDTASAVQTLRKFAEMLESGEAALTDFAADYNMQPKELTTTDDARYREFVKGDAKANLKMELFIPANPS